MHHWKEIRRYCFPADTTVLRLLDTSPTSEHSIHINLILILSRTDRHAKDFQKRLDIANIHNALTPSIRKDTTQYAEQHLRQWEDQSKTNQEVGMENIEKRPRKKDGQGLRARKKVVR